MHEFIKKAIISLKIHHSSLYQSFTRLKLLQKHWFYKIFPFSRKYLSFSIFQKFSPIVQNFPIQCFSDAYSMMYHSPTNHPEASVCLFHDFRFFWIGDQCVCWSSVNIKPGVTQYTSDDQSGTGAREETTEILFWMK